MGYEIYMKTCPRPLASECISGASCNHTAYEGVYISFNHTTKSDIWNISMSHGHTGRVVSIQLTRAIARMRSDGVTPSIPTRTCGWSKTQGVFLIHLIRIKDMADRNPDLTFLSDQYWDINPDPDDSNSDGDISDYECDGNDDTYSDHDIVSTHTISLGNRSSNVQPIIKRNTGLDTLYISPQITPRSMNQTMPKDFSLERSNHVLPTSY